MIAIARAPEAILNYEANLDNGNHLLKIAGKEKQKELGNPMIMESLCQP